MQWLLAYDYDFYEFTFQPTTGMHLCSSCNMRAIKIDESNDDDDDNDNNGIVQLQCVSYVRIYSWTFPGMWTVWEILRWKCKDFVHGRHKLDRYVFQWLLAVKLHSLHSPRPENLQRDNTYDLAAVLFVWPPVDSVAANILSQFTADIVVTRRTIPLLRTVLTFSLLLIFTI